MLNRVLNYPLKSNDYNLTSLKVEFPIKEAVFIGHESEQVIVIVKTDRIELFRSVQLVKEGHTLILNGIIIPNHQPTIEIRHAFRLPYFGLIS